MSTKEDRQYPLTVHITSRDVPRSIEFYREKLGFELKECWPDEKNPMFASLLLDRQAILLGGHLPAAEAAKWCGEDQALRKHFTALSNEFEANAPGVGVTIYVQVDDVDAYYRMLTERGVEGMLEPRTQFYGQRDFPVRDPDGYRLTFYTPVAMASCQSCGMPLTDAEPGQMYCQYCTDDEGQLKPYEAVLEGTIQGYFMGMQKMERGPAEAAAKEHLATMPAWSAR